MLYVARDGAGDITAICNNPTTAENLRALIDDSIEEVPTAGAAEDYVFTLSSKRTVSFTACRRMKPWRLFRFGWMMATWPTN